MINIREILFQMRGRESLFIPSPDVRSVCAYIEGLCAGRGLDTFGLNRWVADEVLGQSDPRGWATMLARVHYGTDVNQAKMYTSRDRKLMRSLIDKVAEWVDVELRNE